MRPTGSRHVNTKLATGAGVKQTIPNGKAGPQNNESGGQVLGEAEKESPDTAQGRRTHTLADPKRKEQ